MSERDIELSNDGAGSNVGGYFGEPKGPERVTINGNPILDANGLEVLTLKTSGPISFVINLGNRPALTLRRDGDQIVAEYDPVDLTPAAQVFVDEVQRLLNLT